MIDISVVGLGGYVTGGVLQVGDSRGDLQTIHQRSLMGGPYGSERYIRCHSWGASTLLPPIDQLNNYMLQWDT